MMLSKIKLDNYTTFFKETTIDFSATNYKFLEEENVGPNRILKGALFVGENASGKTKIINSIKFLLDILFKDEEFNFLLNKSFYTKKKSYKLEYTFVVNGNEIVYLIELGSDKIISEKLTLNHKEIIDRLGKNAIFKLNDEKTFEDISEKLLFLRRVYFDTHFYDDTTLNKWFDYMKDSVYINCYTPKISSYSGKSLLAHNYLEEHDTKGINELLDKINYNQTINYSSDVLNINREFSIKKKDNSKFISFNKKGTDVYIPEGFESTGNITLINLLPSLLHVINNDCMLILDEFSSGFHNELEECLIKYFFHFSKNSQMFFVSHSTNILNNTILRPDQIYSVTFSSKNGSVLKRFSEEMPRESQNTEKMYLNGVFNGMPRYNKFFKD